MKNLTKLMLFLLAGLFMFTACKDDDEPTPEPRISEFHANGSKDVSQGSHKFGDTINFKLTLRADGGLATYIVRESITGAGSNDIVNESLSGEIVDKTLQYIITNENVNQLEFRLTDKEGQTVVKTYGITVTPGETALGNLLAGQFYHIQGTGKGAYNLLTDMEMAASDQGSHKDMENTDLAGATFTGSWKSGTGNNTMFVKKNEFDFTGATYESAKDAYSEGTATLTVLNPAVNDIYIAKVRGQDEYIVIKIEEIDPNFDPGSSGNKGRIKFSYRKK